MKKFKGKAIYNPSGKAGEYSYWACNFYVGCSNGCTYCYCKKGLLARSMGNDQPRLKKCFQCEVDAFVWFTVELQKNLTELRRHGLFFTFSSDPFLEETYSLTIRAVEYCMAYDVPVKILTKSAMAAYQFKVAVERNPGFKKKLVAVGFTLTGHDELEPNASSNEDRIHAMRQLHGLGIRIWASIEPIIDIERSKEMIFHSCGWCDIYKIGLESGRKYERKALRDFINWTTTNLRDNGNALIYFKDSLLKQAGISREELPENCVGRDYNVFLK